MGRHPVGQFTRYRLEVAPASEFLRTEALGHLAGELDDVTLFGSGDEDAGYSPLSQLVRDRSSALWVELLVGHYTMVVRTKTSCCCISGTPGDAPS